MIVYKLRDIFFMNNNYDLKYNVYKNVHTVAGDSNDTNYRKKNEM